MFAGVFLGLAAAVVLASAAGVLVMRGVHRKLHFVTPAALVAPVLVALAVFIRQGLDENTGESVLAVLFVVIAGPFLSHATIRAARIRDEGDWRGSRPGRAPSRGSREALSRSLPSGEQWPS
ncbi:MAG TPA: monovalent cation/H(+) antiporter subunit G [Streptosporangiaceae bacterium]|nr:monovalent cation/H(+) antiporter subunit G [Streptosporangiaceae bacterium]